MRNNDVRICGKLCCCNGRARVRLHDRSTGETKIVYLGYPAGSLEASAEYLRVRTAWLAGASIKVDGTVTELVEVYLRGRTPPPRERLAMKFLVAEAGEDQAAGFGPNKLRALRDKMIADRPAGRGWGRDYAVAQTARIVALWKWAAARELVPESVWRALTALEPLKAGRVKKIVPPVAVEHINAIRPLVPAVSMTLIDLQLLTGAREGELIGLEAGDIDRTDEAWKVNLDRHKTAHRGKSRFLYFGPKAQAILSPLILSRPTGPLLLRADGRPLTASAYWHHIDTGCRAAGIPHWTPHQLRHTAATMLAKEFGVETARVLLGHASARVTAGIYIDRDDSLARRAIMSFG